MVEIAKALSYESELLIMDEPTSALTERDAEHLFTIIRELKAQGRGILYITHKMDELFEIGTRYRCFATADTSARTIPATLPEIRSFA